MPFLWIHRGLMGIVLCLAGLLGYQVYTQMGPRIPPVTLPSPSSTESSGSAIQGFHYQKTQSGALQWEVQAQKAQVLESEHKAILEQVEVHLYEDGDRKMTIMAETGNIDTATNNFLLVNRGDPIEVKFSSGYTIFTPSLRWIDDRQEFRTADQVLIGGDGLTITGEGLEGLLNEEEFTILNNVRVHVSS